MKYYQKKILVDLFESANGLQPFTFYSRYKLKPELMVELIDSLKAKDLVEIQNNILFITNKGKDYLKSNKFKNFSHNKFKNIPVDYIDGKISVNAFYIPNITYISD